MLVRDARGFFRVPKGSTQKANDIEVQAAIVKHQQAVSEQSRREYIRHVKRVHQPKSSVCPDCKEGKLRKGEGIKRISAERIKVKAW